MKKFLPFFLFALLSVFLIGYGGSAFAAGGAGLGQALQQQQQAAAAAAAAACTAPGYLSSCWSCDFFGQFASMGLNAAAKVFAALAPQLKGMITFMYLVWIAIQAMRMFFPDAGGFPSVKNIAVKTFIVCVIWFALGNPTNGGGSDSASSVSGNSALSTYNEWVFAPIMNGGATLSSEIMGYFSGTNFKDVFGVDDYQPNVQLTSSMQAASGSITQIMTLINRMQHVNGWGFYIGWKVFINALKTASIYNLSGLAGIPAGLVLMFIFAIALVSFPFYIIDLFLRVIFLTALAPIAIGSFIFKPLRRVTFAALNGLLQSAFTLAMTGAVVGFTGALMASSLSYTGSNGQAGVGTFAQFACAVSNNSWLGGAQFGFDTTGFWFLLFAGVLSVGTMSKARGLAGALFGGFDDGQSLGDKAGGLVGRSMMFAAQGTGVALTLGKDMAKAAGGVAGEGGLAMARAGIGALGGGLASMLPGGQTSQLRALTSNLTPQGMSNGSSGGPGGGGQTP